MKIERLLVVMEIAKKVIKKIYHFFTYTMDILLGKQPPNKRIFIGGTHFKEIGNEFLKYFVELGNINQSVKVLDVGCGIGRMAVPLAKYLSKDGAYEGFDIVADGINWCKKNVAAKHPNFNFQIADIYNSLYNPDGKYKASEYRFPYDDSCFDFIFLTSVFTHMFPQDTENYLSEIARVLKKQERCLITWFMLNEESSKLIDTGKSNPNFKYEFDGYRTNDKNNQAAAVAYNEEFVRKLYEKYQLKIIEPIHYGSWCGREKFLSYQDIIIAVKT